MCQQVHGQPCEVRSNRALANVLGHVRASAGLQNRVWIRTPSALNRLNLAALNKYTIDIHNVLAVQLPLGHLAPIL